MGERAKKERQEKNDRRQGDPKYNSPFDRDMLEQAIEEDPFTALEEQQKRNKGEEDY